MEGKNNVGDGKQVETIQPGYLYVLVHPSEPDLYKIGVTILRPEEQLAQHNRHYQEFAGQIVKQTGQEWQLKTYIAVLDPYWAERAFWGVTGLSEMPGGVTIEVQKLKWTSVQAGLDAAQKAGVRPGPLRKKAVRDSEWMRKLLEGSGITMIGRYGGLIKHTEFQCEKGHVFKASAGVFANRKSCPCCVEWNWGGPRGLRVSLR